MSNPTTPFGWQMPTSTDLVTDLPADFEVFGQAVATSMADLLGGASGYILSKASATDMDFTWIANDQGDITAVTAGTGISGGGTSGAVTITNSMATEITAKGDLIAGTGSATFDNLPVGTNNQILVADNTTSTGLKWATPSTSALTLISASDFSAVAGVNIDSCFTTTYTNYLVVWNRITSVSAQGQFQFRTGGVTNTNANYNWASYYIALGSSPLGYESGGSQTVVNTGMGEATTITSVCMMYVFQPQATQYTTYTWTNQHAGGYTQWGGGRFAATTSFDGIRLAPASGTFTGSVQVYGLGK